MISYHGFPFLHRIPSPTIREKVLFYLKTLCLRDHERIISFVMKSRSKIPINVVHLLPVLDKQLIHLLQSISPDDWNQPTIAKQWCVKDIAAHLLDGNIRTLSILRDKHFGENAQIESYQDLVDFLNRLNADWVKAMKRVSPDILVLLLEFTGKPFCDYFASIDPFEKSLFAVDWAGEKESLNWMETARQYTEKWLHQQQIRDALNRPGIMTRELFHPFISIFMLALPHTFRNIDAAEQTLVKINITTDIGGSWFLIRQNNKWAPITDPIPQPATELSIDPDTAWKLFSKSLRPKQVMDRVIITGNRLLGETALGMVSVMA
jgi:uncharacterized protein (TIGR03083 family)